MLTQAKDMYLKFEKKPFGFEHCWEVLRKHDKWGAKAKEISDKRSGPKKDKKGKGKEGAAAAPNVVQEGVDGGSSSKYYDLGVLLIEMLVRRRIFNMEPIKFRHPAPLVSPPSSPGSARSGSMSPLTSPGS
ncbi:hypothetical protein BDB00DRAFT_782986 [Zychaea mexicana]|uniref:uncharacterized protein n=1 Tax=Zychaea mexicana TaxID=64656 RepID=UPI0022FE6386|nr:uncharacterized protein BDB00DRAFT_782986 [Zychaea mexicana]KAI9499476.1 hypothetical protein BDB00DRAFT_782986 [Zychaea mexicana]